MWRYPSTASFIEGLWPFRPRKFEAITGRVLCCPVGGVCTGRGLSSNHKRLSATDISAPRIDEERSKMRYLVELQNPVNHRVFERKMRPKSHSARGHVCLGVTHRVAPRPPPPQWGCVSFGAETGLPCPWCGWPKKESPLTDARLVVVVKAFVSSRADAREALSQ
ncbi:hypothetical protein L6452_46438 [Arctium lappa]|nr:hypothetical protein L6452_46438 [Arctium lappa]